MSYFVKQKAGAEKCVQLPIKETIWLLFVCK